MTRPAVVPGIPISLHSLSCSSPQQDNNHDGTNPDQDDNNTTAICATMQRVLAWADRELLSLLRAKPTSSQKRQRAKKLMNAADATLLANPSGSESDLQETIANQTLPSTSMLSQTLLDTTVSIGGGVKRAAGGGALKVGVQVIQVGYAL